MKDWDPFWGCGCGVGLQEFGVWLCFSGIWVGFEGLGFFSFLLGLCLGLLMV